MAPRQTRLIATSHGTDRIAGQWAITALVDAVRRQAPHLAVEQAYVDVQQPNVNTVLDGALGPRVVVPLLLAAGHHVFVDIDNAVKRGKATAALALGPDIRLAGVLMRRLREAGATGRDVIVLGAAGSSDARALDSVERSALLLKETWGSDVSVGYIGGAGKPIAEVVDGARAHGRRVVVATFLMAPGYFFDRLVGCGADAVAAPLLDGGEPDARLVDLVLDRFEEASSQIFSSAIRRVRLAKSRRVL